MRLSFKLERVQNSSIFMLSAREVIVVDPEILGGTPVFRGTRVAIQTLFDHLESSSLDDFLEGFPSVSREQAEAVMQQTRLQP